LRREGWVVNHKRVQRLWQEARLQVPRSRRRRRRLTHPEQVPTQATYPGQVWTYDFVHDACWNGAKLKVLPVVDEFTRECLAIEVATSLPAARVIAVLARLFAQHGAPAYSLAVITGQSLWPTRSRPGWRSSTQKRGTSLRAVPGRMASAKASMARYGMNASICGRLLRWLRPVSSWSTFAASIMKNVPIVGSGTAPQLSSNPTGSRTSHTPLAPNIPVA
jgi:transposase InsO family protein